MKKMLLLTLLALSPLAWSQNAPLQGISESTDPAKVRDVEKRADELRQRQQQMGSSGASDAGASKASASSEKRAHRRAMKRSRKHKQ